MAQTRIVLLFNEENERQKTVCDFLKSQARCKTAIITELVYQWLKKGEGYPIVHSKEAGENKDMSLENIKHRLLEDKEFLKQIREELGDEKEQIEEDTDMDLDEDMLLAGIDLFEQHMD